MEGESEERLKSGRSVRPAVSILSRPFYGIYSHFVFIYSVHKW